MNTRKRPDAATPPFARKAHAVGLGLVLATGAAALGACGGAGSTQDETAQPVLGTRSKSLIIVDGKQFRDLNANGKLDPYEDWRLTAEQRADDLVARMSLEEKTGMMMIDTLNSGCEGSVSSTAYDYVQTQKMTRFILRNTAN